MTFTRILWCAATVTLLAIVPLRVDAAPLMTVNWERLPIVIGKTVSIAMPGGSVITGKATAVESDALLVDAKTTSDAKAYPKGPVRVPRATLHRLEMQSKGTKFRILCTTLAAAVGVVGGVVAAWKVEGGILGNKNTGKATAAFIGIAGGAAALGYLAGNAADKHWTPVEIIE